MKRLQVAPDIYIPEEQAPEAIIFDFDGVIIDSMEAFDKAFVQIFERSRASYNGLETLKEVFDEGMWDGLKAKGVKLSTREVLEILLPHLEKTDLFPEIPPTIKTIGEKKSNIDLTIISANSTDFVRGKLEQEQLAIYFNTIIGVDSQGGKPEKIRGVVQRGGFDIKKVYYVGDTKGDMVDSRTAGVHPAAAAWGFHEKARLMKESSTEFLLDKPSDLLRIAGII
jgi:phosphoglycolate phosphatase